MKEENINKSQKTWSYEGKERIGEHPKLAKCGDLVSMGVDQAVVSKREEGNTIQVSTERRITVSCDKFSGPTAGFSGKGKKPVNDPWRT